MKVNMSKRKSNFYYVTLCFLLVFSLIVQKPVSANAKTKFVLVALSDYTRQMKIGDEFQLMAVASDLSLPTYKSSNSGIASVNTYGLVTAKKAGIAKITAKVTGGEASCLVTVRKTDLTISKTEVTLECEEGIRLRVTSSTNSDITWKSSRSSVATVDDEGFVGAIKPGKTTITASADGTKVTCKVTVKKPDITLNSYEITLPVGNTFKLNAEVSSGLEPVFSSSRSSVASVDDIGNIIAEKSGTAYIRCKLHGVTKTCKVKVPKAETTKTTKNTTTTKTTKTTKTSKTAKTAKATKTSKTSKKAKATKTSKASKKTKSSKVTKSNKTTKKTKTAKTNKAKKTTKK